MFEEDTSPQPAPSSGMSKTFGVILALVIAALAAGGYFWVAQQNHAMTQQVAALQAQTETQTNQIQALESRLHLSADELERLSTTANQVQHSVSQTQAQLANTQKQTQTLAEQQQAAAADLANVKQDTGAKLGAINGQINGVQGAEGKNEKDIAKTQSDLEATTAQLKSTIGDLGVQSGLIATTRDQLTALERKGERAYFEFKLTKTKTPTKVGSISLVLKKVDAKHSKYTLDVYADDAQVEKKDKTLNEPVQFMVGSQHALNELVIYSMDKNSVTGYLSAPKYSAAAAASAGSGQ